MRKIFFLFFLIIIAGASYLAYLLFVSPNVKSEKRVGIKIPTGSSYQEVLEILDRNNVLIDARSFDMVCQLKKYPEKINAGHYVFTKGMNNRQIVNMLKSGLQTPVSLVIYNIRTKEDFAGLVGRVLELDSNELLAKLNDAAFCKAQGLDTDQILSRYIVDNYEFYWNTSQEKFLAKMSSAYDNFWNADRKAKAAALNMSPAEVTTLASIVEKEVIFDKEMPTVAGVYLNRIRIGMPLQADPTLVFALRDFSARRVTDYHKQYESPFNTYKHAGLPPGQICMPRKKSIDAVLNAETNEYIYFCANPDMSGYSIFSKTYEEQMRVAAEYRRKLDAMNIR